MENKTDTEKKSDYRKSWWRCYHGGSSFWGWLFIVVGVYFFAKHLGWIPLDLPIWPPVLIVLGVYFLVRRKCKIC